MTNMTTSTRRHLITFTLVALAICGWTVGILVIGPRELVEAIGVQNGYLLVFLVALFGGMSSLGGAIYVTSIITLASGGLNPVYLAAASGAGISIGDSIYYYLGWRGSHLLPQEGWLSSRIRRFSVWLEQQARWLRAAAIFGYTAFTPFPNDILTIALGITKQPYVLVITSLVLGNMVHTYLLASFGSFFPF